MMTTKRPRAVTATGIKSRPWMEMTMQKILIKAISYALYPFVWFYFWWTMGMAVKCNSGRNGGTYDG